MSSDELELANIQQELKEAKAKEKALNAVLMNKPCPSDDIVDIYNLYKNMPTDLRYPTLKDIESRIASVLMMKAHQTATSTKQEKSFKYSAKVQGAAKYIHFRRKVYEYAFQHGAFDEEIKYSDSPIKSTSDLDIVLYFETKPQAQSFRSSLYRLVEKYSGENHPIDSTPTLDDHVCLNATLPSNVKSGNTPERNLWKEEERDNCMDDEDTLPSSVYHNELTEEEIRRECLCDYSVFSTGNFKALWAHIRAKKRCRYDVEKKSSANRIVVNWNFHSMFDANLTNDGKTPTLSVYFESRIDNNRAVENGYQKVKVRVIFMTAILAQQHQVFLRQEGLVQHTPTEFTVVLEKKVEVIDEFERYLKERHDNVMKLWGR